MRGLGGLKKFNCFRKTDEASPTPAKIPPTGAPTTSAPTVPVAEPASKLKTRASGSKTFSRFRTLLGKTPVANEAAPQGVKSASKKPAGAGAVQRLVAPMPKGAVLHAGKSVSEMLSGTELLRDSGPSWADSLLDGLQKLNFPEFHAVFGAPKTVGARDIRVTLAKKMIDDLTGPDAQTSGTASALDEVAQWPGSAADRKYVPDADARTLLQERFAGATEYLERFELLQNAHKKQVVELLTEKHWTDAMDRVVPDLIASMTGLRVRLFSSRDGGVQEVAYGGPEAKRLTLARSDLAYEMVVERDKREFPPIERGAHIIHSNKRIEQVLKPGESLGDVEKDGNCGFQSLLDLELPSVAERFKRPGQNLTVADLRSGAAEQLIMMLVEYNALPPDEKAKMESGEDEVLIKSLCATSVGETRTFSDEALKAFIGSELKDCVNAADFVSLTPEQRAHVASVATHKDWMHDLGDVQPLLFARMAGVQTRVLHESEAIEEGLLRPTVTETFWGKKDDTIAPFALRGEHYQPILRKASVSAEQLEAEEGAQAPDSVLKIDVQGEKTPQEVEATPSPSSPAPSIAESSKDEQEIAFGTRGPVPGFRQGMFVKQRQHRDFEVWLTDNDFRLGERLAGPNAGFDAFLGLHMREITAAFGTDARQMRTRLATWLIEQCSVANQEGVRPQDAQRGSVMRWMGCAPAAPRSAEAQAALAETMLDDEHRRQFGQLDPREQAHVAALLDVDQPPGAVVEGLLPQAVATLSRLSVQVLDHSADEADKAMRRRVYGDHSSKRATVAIDDLGECRSVHVSKKVETTIAQKEVRELGQGRRQHFGVSLQGLIGAQVSVVAVKPNEHSVFESLRRLPQLQALLGGAGGEPPSAQDIGRRVLPFRAIERLIAFNQLPEDEQARVMAKDPLMARLNQGRDKPVTMDKPQVKHLEALSIVMPADVEELARQRAQGPVPFGQLPLHQWEPVLDLVNDLLIKDASRPEFLEGVAQVLGVRLRVLSEGRGVQDGRWLRTVEEAVHGPDPESGGQPQAEAMLVLRPDPRFADPVVPRG